MIWTKLLPALASFGVLTAPLAAQTLSSQEARTDLTALYEGLQAAHIDLYEATSKSHFDTVYEGLYQRYSQQVLLTDFHRDLTRFTALSRHAHAKLEVRNPGWAMHAETDLIFPLSLSIANGAVVISSVPPNSTLRVGDEILEINGEPNAIWLHALTAYVSAETAHLAYEMISGREPLYYWQAYGAVERFDILIERDGQRQRHQIDAVDLETWLNAPVERQGPELSGREARMMSSDIAYLRPGPFFDPDAASAAEAYRPEALNAYRGFIDESFEQFIASGARSLILDLRDNPGGDSSYSDPVIAWFADEPFRFASRFMVRVSKQTIASNQARLDGDPGSQTSQAYARLFAQSEPGSVIPFDIPLVDPRAGTRFERKVFVLVNKRSFSNAVTVAALIQDYGFGTVIGEPTLDMATAFGAMEHFTLPVTRWQVGYPKAHLVRPNGREDLHPLTPDVVLEPNVHAQSDDPLLAAAMAFVLRGERE